MKILEKKLGVHQFDGQTSSELLAAELQEEEDMRALSELIEITASGSWGSTKAPWRLVSPRNLTILLKNLRRRPQKSKETSSGKNAANERFAGGLQDPQEWAW